MFVCTRINSQERSIFKSADLGNDKKRRRREGGKKVRQSKSTKVRHSKSTNSHMNVMIISQLDRVPQRSVESLTTIDVFYLFEPFRKRSFLYAESFEEYVGL